MKHELGHGARLIGSSSRHRRLVSVFLLCFIFHTSYFIFPACAQVVAVRPDQVAPGMTVVLEVLARASDTGHFGKDGLSPTQTLCRFYYPSDSDRVVLGPMEVSWNGRLLQLPVFVLPSDTPSSIPIVIASPRGYDTILFNVVYPQQFPTLSGNVVLGEGAYGPLSDRNTLVVDQLVAINATITVSLRDPDTTRPGNSRLEPVTILSKGPILLTNSTISVGAQGVNGGPGGGGGGHGFMGEGGFGFTGGGNCGVDVPTPNAGSDSDATSLNGGRSITGVLGGGSLPTAGDDQGGGGGTGAPFGSSGAAGLVNHNSPLGGSGGGSGGGEATQLNLAYGGGGGAFGSDGVTGGGGTTPNNGLKNGGRFLIPMAGGSGGGGGNSEVSLNAGSGGGGGGAIALVSFDSIVVVKSVVGATGDSGTSGGKNTAGGGGGSGGAIYLASQRGISIADPELSVSCGAGGRGGLGQFLGGDGGLGRLRMDGAKALPTVVNLEPVSSSGASIDAHSIGMLVNFLHLTGYSPDLANDLDSIRIYFRSPHTNWQHLDTVRSRQSGTWSKWLPKDHDSIEFVMVMIKVASPTSASANFEPGWVMSHVGMMILSQNPSPFMVVLDTLNFGTVRVGHCRMIRLPIANEGGDTLRIDSVSVQGSTYVVRPAGRLKVAPYSSDTVDVTFCPLVVGLDTTRLTIYSNDSLNTARRVLLIGTGTKRNDSLTVTPPSVHFSRVLIGVCDTDSVVFRSVGTDTVYLNATQWSKPPFSLILSPADSTLAPGATAKGFIIFCAPDSGDYATAFILDAHLGLLPTTGHAVLRRVAIESDAAVGDVCAGTVATFQESVANVGNDTIALISASSSNRKDTATSPGLPGLIPAHTSLLITWSLHSVTPGVYHDTLSYTSTDSVYTTVLTYRVLSPSLTLDTILDFHSRCVGTSDTLTLDLRNTGVDTIAVHLGSQQLGRVFSLLDSSATLRPSDTMKIRIIFNPDSVGADSGQLLVSASAGTCNSVYAVMLRGTGTMAALAAADVTFDTTTFGLCRDDSMLVENPCGPPLTIDSIPIHLPFEFLDSAALPVVIQSGGSHEFHFRFCPDHPGSSLDTLEIGKPLAIHPVLRGFGVIAKKPWVHFTVTSATVQSGSTVPFQIRLDSASFDSALQVTATLTFDPAVVWPSGPGANSAPGAYSFPESIDFSKTPQRINTIDILGLIGPRSSTVLGLAITPDSLFDLRVTTGLATVQDCTGLSGKVSVSGAYQLGPVTPTIVADEATVPILLGNDGFVEGEIFDVTGSFVRLAFAGEFRRGDYRLSVPVDGLSSGRYFLRVRSLGWISTAPFLIEK